ncbi:MAG: threonine/serine dehydratase [Alphaproteobacteria bacterium]|nr:threonine/serine dehydratase [Alphaproteobacteria bacterium]
MSITSVPNVTIADVEAAAEVLAGVAMRTPLVENSALNERSGGRVLLKAETLQRTGSFKFRGAYNKITSLPAQLRTQGILAWSSGNHAQGVAEAARLLGAPATIVMPRDAPAIKIDNTRRLGAEVILYDRYNESREEIGARIAHERGLAIVKPYDDPLVIAGQGTVGLEIDEQCQRIGAENDILLVNCSGGGLAAGCATAIAARSPATEIYAVEPQYHDDMARSLAAGERQTNPPDAPPTLCDALMARAPGEITFPIARELLSGGLSVSDAEVKHAVRYAYEVLKLVVEPGGAASLAAVLSGRIECRGKTVCLILSGGNISPGLLSEILADP